MLRSALREPLTSDRADNFFRKWHKDCPAEKLSCADNLSRGHFYGGAMKSSRRIRVKTTLGELVTAIWEETEALFKFKKAERQLVVVAYILNHLLTRRDYGSHRIATKKR
jgi:hypothetical protein